MVAKFPQTLPANTVVGRLGVGPGPSEAVPIGKLLATGTGTINALAIGAKGDGITDDTAALQAGNDAAASFGGSLYIPATANGYNTSATVHITCRHVFGDAFFIDDGILGTFINFNPPPLSPDLTVGFDCSGSDGATVNDITVFGPFGYSPATLVSSGTVTPGSLPNYSAFAPGVAAFGTSGAGKVTFNRCAGLNAKVGLLLNGQQGHTTSNGCAWGGGNLFGVYCKTNSETYRFSQTGIGGNAWCGVLFGTTPFAGHNGGMAASFFQSSNGFQPYAFYQCDDAGIGASNANGYFFIFADTAFEAIGECVIKALDNNVSASVFICLDSPGFSWDTSSFILPDAIIPSGSKQAFALNLGNVSTFRLPYGAPHPFVLSSINSSAQIARVYLDNSGSGSFDHNALLANGGITIVNPEQAVDNLRAFPVNDYQHRQEKATRSAVIQTPNMLLNPETTGNWTPLSNVAVTLSNYSTLHGGALSAATFPRQFFEELGDNANCVVLTPSASPWDAKINFSPNPTSAGLHCPALSFWIVKAGSSFEGHEARLGCTGGVFVYDNVYSINNVAQKIWGVGQNSGGATYVNFEISGTSTNAVYIFGLMVSLDDLAQYNPTQGPSLIGTPFLQSQTTANSATGGAASALPALPSAYLQINIGGTNFKIPYYAV